MHTPHDQTSGALLDALREDALADLLQERHPVGHPAHSGCLPTVYTVWVSRLSGEGPTHVSVQNTADPEVAKTQALAAAAKAWALPGVFALQVVQVVAGDIDFDNWNDGY